MEKKKVVIRVHEVVGGDAAISTEDGEAAFQRISTALGKGMQVIVDFRNINLIVSAFMNAAIGQLYGVFDEKQLVSDFEVQGLNEEDKIILKKVIARAKQYFKNKDLTEHLVRKATKHEKD